MTSDPVAALISLADHLHRGELPPEPIRAHVARAISAWLNGAPIDRALHLRPAARGYAIRDTALRQAGELVDGCKYRLADEITRFECRVWPRWRDLPNPPPGSTAIDEHLFRAFATGRKIPASPKHLGRILDKNSC